MTSITYMQVESIDTTVPFNQCQQLSDCCSSPGRNEQALDVRGHLS